MKVFTSSNSTEVKIITVLTLIIFALIIFSIFYGQTSVINIYLKIFISLIIAIGTIYFYSNSLKEVKLTEKYLILKKNIGQKKKEDVQLFGVFFSNAIVNPNEYYSLFFILSHQINYEKSWATSGRFWGYKDLNSQSTYILGPNSFSSNSVNR